MVHALGEERSDREIWGLHSARNGREHSFVAEAQGLLASLPRARRRVCYSRPGRKDVEGHDFDIAGRLTGSVLADLNPPRDAQAYLCGPAGSMDGISAALAAVGIDAAHIHTGPSGPAPGVTPGIATTHAPAPHPPAGEPGNGPTIEFARSNLAIPWASDTTPNRSNPPLTEADSSAAHNHATTWCWTCDRQQVMVDGAATSGAWPFGARLERGRSPAGRS